MESQLKNRTKVFAHNCVKLVTCFPNTILGRHLGSQLIRCATSVAANYRAACLAQTKKGFVSKLSIVIEEIDESNFGLEFAYDENLIREFDKIKILITESNELTRVFVASRKTATQNLLAEDKMNYNSQ